MRTGGSLVMNILSLTENTHLFNERLNFFRFVYGSYNLSSPYHTELALEEFRIRLEYRSNLNFESDIIAKKIFKKGCSEAVFYDEIYKYFLKSVGKINWGEYANLQWRYIPHFLEIFPNGKIIIVMRDPRAIIASFKKLTFMPGHLYLNIIFNWIDFINYLHEYQNVYPKTSMHIVKLEDLHLYPETFVPKLVHFAGEKFDPIMLQPDRWPEKLDERYDKVNLSAHTKKKVYGFEPKRNEIWKETLEPSEIELIELIAGDSIELAGYPLLNNKKTLKQKSRSLTAALDHSILKKNYETFLENGRGTDQLPTDPSLPENWSSPENPFKKFSETEKYYEYRNDLEQTKLKLQKKYSSK